MQIEVAALPHHEIAKQALEESSASIARRVEHASSLQHTRQGKSNNLLSNREIDAHCRPDDAGEKLLRSAMTRLDWSARAYHRALKVARTIADLSDSAAIEPQHIAEAIQYRRALRNN